ncbi:MAG: hypothetical protein Ct9H90mP30_4210 [Actinomycetota bacterium]|nr:MAG: hypothetical protein Ct9H90mP30_4210 [Actinomycetota bacterium]
MTPANILQTFNRIAGANGIGRLDIVKNPLRRYEVSWSI